MRTVPLVIEHHRQRGFTLLEILVALTVLGFLTVALNQGVRTGLDLWGMQSREIAKTAELDSTARVLRTLLSGIPLLPTAAVDARSASVAIALVGKPDQLSFVGDMPTGLGGTQRAEITLKLRGKRLVLVWSPHRHDLASSTPAPTETELMSGVDRLQLAYWADTPAGWLTEWDGVLLPRLIRVRLTFAKGDSRHWPDLIAAPLLSSPKA